MGFLARPVWEVSWEEGLQGLVGINSGSGEGLSGGRGSRLGTPGTASVGLKLFWYVVSYLFFLLENKRRDSPQVVIGSPTVFVAKSERSSDTWMKLLCSYEPACKAGAPSAREQLTRPIRPDLLLEREASLPMECWHWSEQCRPGARSPWTLPASRGGGILNRAGGQ